MNHTVTSFRHLNLLSGSVLTLSVEFDRKRLTVEMGWAFHDTKSRKQYNRRTNALTARTRMKYDPITVLFSEYEPLNHDWITFRCLTTFYAVCRTSSYFKGLIPESDIDDIRYKIGNSVHNCDKRFAGTNV